MAFPDHHASWRAPGCARHAALLTSGLALVACQDALAPSPSGLSAVANSALQGAHTAEAVPGAYIVTFREGTADIPGSARRLMTEHGGTVGFTYTAALRGFSARLPAAAAVALARNPIVASVTPDLRVVADDIQAAPTWGLDRIDQRALPLSKSYAYAATGAGVTAYVFDSGIRFDHAEFEGRAVPGFDAFADGRNGGDCYGHGTHVAGTIGGRTYGVAKQVRLVSVRVIGCDGVGYASGIYAGVDWVIAHKSGPAVANFSIGRARDEGYNTVIRRLIAAGVAVSASAGNSDADACLQSPASTPEAVTVGATTAWDSRGVFSNWGSCVDVFAPGNLIVSALMTDPTASGTKTGTSMAAPHATGVMATWLEQSPSLSPAQLHHLVTTSATPNVVTDAKTAYPLLLHSAAVTLTVPVPGPAPTPAPVAPAPPSGLGLRLVTLGRVDLAWTDGSLDETTFQIDRRTGSEAWMPLATVAANATSFSDLTVARDRQYTYRVRAANPAGSSAASNEAAVVVTCSTRRKSLVCQ